MKPTFLTSIPGADPVTLEAVFKASPARLFRAWTDASELAKWFGPEALRLETANTDPREGGLWEFAYPKHNGTIDRLSGTYVEIVPDKRLAFTWTHERLFDDGHSEKTSISLVTVTFEPVGEATRLTLVHERIVKETGRLGVTEGWSQSLNKLLILLGEPEH